MNLQDKDGLLAVITWHGFCDGLTAITHFDHEYSAEGYETLQNLYFALVKDGTGRTGKPVAGFIVKTRMGQSHASFAGVLRLCAGACLSEERIKNWALVIVPYQLDPRGGPLSEDDALQTMTRLLMATTPPASTV